MRKLKNAVGALRSGSITELIALAEGLLQIGDEEGNASIFSTGRTFWLFLHQMFTPGGSCRDAVRKAQAWLSVLKGKSISSSTSAYCQARMRLPLTMLHRALELSCVDHDSEATRDWLWCNRTVHVVDGSSSKMSDTEENQAEYPQFATQNTGCGFPIMNFVGVFSLATGFLTAIKIGNKHWHDISLFRLLFDKFLPGDIVLADRGFCSYVDMWTLNKKKVDVVMRKHQKRSVGSRKIRRLGKNDYLVEWTKSQRKPKWMDEDEWDAIPDTYIIREVFVSLEKRGFRTEKIFIVTTLLDSRLYSKESLAELYYRRWSIELYFRDIKTTMGFDFLRCKTPEMVEKELMMALIAYNIIRRVMADAAVSADVPLGRISFKGTWSTLTQWLPQFNRIRSAKKLKQYYLMMLKVISSDLLLLRPGRREPRAKKMRPKAYPLLNKHRKLFVEIPHRNKYKKAV